MTEESLSTTAKKSLIGLITHRLFPLLLSLILSAIAYLGAWGVKVISHPQYKEYSLVLMATLSGLTILFLLLWLSLYLRFGKLHLAFGVLWDKMLNPRCLHCHAFLKHSSHGHEMLWCPNPECGQKYILKDNTDSLISKHEAIEKMRTS